MLIGYAFLPPAVAIRNLLAIYYFLSFSTMSSSLSTPTVLSTALKEWAVAVDALAEGETIVLLRKGGIREQGSGFAVVQSQAWLYPTYEHQKPHLLKPEYADRVVPVESGWHPEQVEIKAWAEITHTFQVSDATTVEQLLPFPVWNLQFVSERLKWKPKTPISVLLLRVYRLPQAQMINYRSEYGGCKSWIELLPQMNPQIATPVLSEVAYSQQVEQIQQIIEHNNSNEI